MDPSAETDSTVRSSSQRSSKQARPRRKLLSQTHKIDALERQAAMLDLQVRALAKTNDKLHAKQSMQLQMLATYEDSLRYMGALICQLADQGDADAEHQLSVLSAAVLDLKAGTLLQMSAQHPSTAGADASMHNPASNTTTRNVAGDVLGLGESSFPGLFPPADCDGHGSSSSAQHSKSSSSCGAGHHDRPGHSGVSARMAGTQWRSRTQRMWASVTPEAVLAMKGIRTAALAERFKPICARMALVTRCHKGDALAAGLEAAVNEYGITAMLAMLAADEQWLQFCCTNIETLQQESPPRGIWAFVVSKADLSQQQRKQMSSAFDLYQSARTALLQEQAQTVNALQALLGGKHAAKSAGSAQAQQKQATAAHVATHAQSQSGQQAASLSPCAGAAQACMPGNAAQVQQPRQAGTPAAAASRVSAKTGSNLSSHDDSTILPSRTASSPAGSMNDEIYCCSELSTLDLESAEQAEQLLLQLQRNIRLQREYSRRLVYLWMDLLTTGQHAGAILAAYPYSIRVPAVFAYIWEQESDLQQKRGR